jgi:membrane protein YqaA with SNARE-associated domain
MVTVVLTVLAGWLLLSALTSLAFAAIARGGRREDRHPNSRIDAH